MPAAGLGEAHKEFGGIVENVTDQSAAIKDKKNDSSRRSDLSVFAADSTSTRQSAATPKSHACRDHLHLTDVETLPELSTAQSSGSPLVNTTATAGPPAGAC